MARKHPRTDEELFYTSSLGVVYAFKMASGKVKVGRTKDYKKRRRTHQMTIGAASEFVDEYVSLPHLNYKENETLTLQKFSKPGREIFEGDFDAVVKFINSLTFDTREGKELLEHIKVEKQKVADRGSILDNLFPNGLVSLLTSPKAEAKAKTMRAEGSKHQEKIVALYKENTAATHYGSGFLDGLTAVIALIGEETKIEDLIGSIHNARKAAARDLMESRELRLESIQQLEELQNLSAERADLLFSLGEVNTEEEFAIYDLME